MVDGSSPWSLIAKPVSHRSPKSRAETVALSSSTSEPTACPWSSSPASLASNPPGRIHHNGFGLVTLPTDSNETFALKGSRTEALSRWMKVENAFKTARQFSN